MGKILRVFVEDAFDVTADREFQFVGVGAFGRLGVAEKARIHFDVPADEPGEVGFVEHRRAFKEVEKFADVARIIVGAERGDLGFGEMFAEAVEPPAVRDVADVILVLAERRHTELHDIEPHEEVFAEFAGADAGRKIAVGGGDESDVRLDFGASADAHEASAFEDAQEESLRLERQFADFIEEERPSVREFEESEFLTIRTGERALLVSEKPRLQQFRIHARAVEGVERFAIARRFRMDLERDRFLAGAALAEDEDARFGMERDLIDVGAQFGHRGAFADEFAVAVAAVVFDYRTHFGAPAGLGYAAGKIFDRRRVGKVILIIPIGEHRRVKQFVIGGDGGGDAGTREPTDGRRGFTLRGGGRRRYVVDKRQEGRDIGVKRLADGTDERAVERSAAVLTDTEKRCDSLRLRVAHGESADPGDDRFAFQMLQRRLKPRLVAAETQAHENNLLPIFTFGFQKFGEAAFAHTHDDGIAVQCLERGRRRDRVFLPTPAGQNDGIVFRQM